MTLLVLIILFLRINNQQHRLKAVDERSIEAVRSAGIMTYPEHVCVCVAGFIVLYFEEFMTKCV